MHGGIDNHIQPLTQPRLGQRQARDLAVGMVENHGGVGGRDHEVERADPFDAPPEIARDLDAVDCRMRPQVLDDGVGLPHRFGQQHAVTALVERCDPFAQPRHGLGAPSRLGSVGATINVATGRGIALGLAPDPGRSSSTGKGGGIHPDMKPALYYSLVAFALLAIALIWVRARSERTRQRVLALEQEAAERGLLEET